MATTNAPAAGVQMIALSEIRHDQNVRQQLHPEEVDALASSIALLGQLSPVSVRPTDNGPGWVLIAGHKRYAALEQLGYTEIRAEVRPDGETEAAERAAENLVRSPLDSYEEAVAVKAMLERGLTEDGAAQALGWPKARVTARMKLLELPERAQQLTGQGVIPLSAVEELRQIGKVSPKLLDVLVDHVSSEDGRWVARELASNPGRALGEALRCSDSKTFAAHLDQVRGYDIEQLRLGKKTEALLAEAEKLHKQISEYAYGPPTIRFAELEVDQARAAGVLIELERSTPIITDRSLYRELCKQAIRRTVEDLRVRAAELADQRKQAKAAGRPVDPAAEARREHGRRTRQLAEQAHGANLDLGRALMNGLACVDPASIDVARLMVYGLLGPDWDESPYTQTGDRIAELAARGIRLVIEEFRADVTKNRKDGTRGALRIDYGDPRKPEKPIAWVLKWLDSARTAGDLYGRAIVVLAAEQYASRLVVPSSQQHPPMRWSSHKDHARKALAKLAGPHIPATLKQLEKAVAKAKADHDQATRPANRRRGANSAAVDEAFAKPDVEVVDEPAENELKGEDLDEQLDEPELGTGDGDGDAAVGPNGAVYSAADPGL
jgi:ParB/RepB/Spo0J family partition protein